jgi:PilZ domain
MDAESKGRAERKRVLRGGKIILANLMSTFECKLRNVSSSGALLIVNNAANIPDEFYLSVDFQPGRRPCHVAWRKMNELGVEFLDTN